MSNFFKIYCYAQENDEDVVGGLVSCSEISLQADPEVLRQVADFILRCAKRLDASEDAMRHFHLRDEWSEWGDEYPDIIVCNARKAD